MNVDVLRRAILDAPTPSAIQDILVLFATHFLVVIRRRLVSLSKNQRNVMCGNAAVV